MKKPSTNEAARSRGLSNQELDGTAGGFSDWDTCDWAGKIGGAGGGAVGSSLGVWGSAAGALAGDAGGSYLCENLGGGNQYWGGGSYTNGNPHSDYGDWM